MLEKSKLEKLKSLNNDYTDLIIKFDEYINREINCNPEKVYKSFEEINCDEEGTLYVFFTKKEVNRANAYVVPLIESDGETIDESAYYFGKSYTEKLNSMKVENKLIEMLSDYKRVKFVFDIADISSFPLFETKMYRKMERVLKEISKLSVELIDEKKVYEIITNPRLEEKEDKKLFDIDVVIKYIKEISSLIEISNVYISDTEDKKDRFLIEELKKLVYASTLSAKERNEYIYDTTYKSMNEMFSKFGFCLFKENKCISQRHKSITNRYPTPRTDGCCFKTIRKCKYNNKDGTCQVECLPCKLFACMYLSKLGVGIRIGELILMRAFLTQKQRRLLIYKFYKPKEFFMKRMS